MKLRELNLGDRFRYAQYPDGGTYLKGSKVSGTIDLYYVHDKLIGYIYMAEGNDEIVKVEG